MTPYLLLLFSSVIIAYYGRRYGSVGVRRLSLILIGSLLVLFAGLRSVKVGSDTGTYVRHFLSVTSIEDMWRTTEVGYYTLNFFAASISDDYFVLLSLIALIVVLCYFSVFFRLVKRYETAVFLFVALGFYTFFFNGARQGLAAAVCFLAIPSLLERRLLSYLIIIFFAALFHHTALIALPLYFVAKPYLTWRQILSLFAGSILAALFLSFFVRLAAQLINDDYAAYAEETEGGGRVMTLFLLTQGIALVAFGKSLVKDQAFFRLLNIYLIGMVPVVAATLSNVNPSGLLRLHVYFSHTALLLWPMLFYKMPNSPHRLALALGLLFVMLAFFVLTTSSFSHLVPYRLNPVLMTWL